MEDLITKIEQMQAEARDGMKRASRDSDPYLYQYLVGKFHAFGKVAGILKKQKECVADSSKTSADEDERTRKEIIHYLFYTAGGLSIEEQNRWIAYLEKQKEQKPAEWSEDIIRKAVKEVGLTQHQIDWFKTNIFSPKQEWSGEDEDMLNSCISSIEEAKENRYAYKETDGDTSYDHEIAWLKSLRPVSKESLQSWKPSEEQMKALLKAVDKARELHYSSNSGYDEYDVLRLLYKQLKKLM